MYTYIAYYNIIMYKNVRVNVTLYFIKRVRLEYSYYTMCCSFLITLR